MLDIKVVAVFFSANANPPIDYGQVRVITDM